MPNIVTTTRKFGWTQVEVPVIGQGTWGIEGSPESEAAAISALRAGIDLGLNHIDTAEGYAQGRVEELVGRAIAGRRHRVFLVSKVGPGNASYEGTLRACERSLRRLNADWLDLYLLHWPSPHPIRETMRGMEELVTRRLVRYFGVSNFTVRQMQDAQRALRNERLACNQVPYHLGARAIERRLLPHCATLDTAIVGYSPFGHGAFIGSADAGGLWDNLARFGALFDWSLLREIGESHHRTPRQVALNFLTRHACVFTIPKASVIEHVRENAGGAGWTLSYDEIRAIERAFPTRGAAQYWIRGFVRKSMRALTRISAPSARPSAETGQGTGRSTAS